MRANSKYWLLMLGDSQTNNGLHRIIDPHWKSPPSKCIIPEPKNLCPVINDP